MRIHKGIEFGMTKTQRKTRHKYAVYSAVAELDGAAFGFSIVQGAKINAGTVYGILLNAVNKGDMTREWEDIDESAEKRPRRRYYTLTASGQKTLEELEAHFEGYDYA